MMLEQSSGLVTLYLISFGGSYGLSGFENTIANEYGSNL